MKNYVINFSHPSIIKHKNIRPIITYSEYGLIELNKNIHIPFKTRESRHSAISNQDVSINGTYTLRRQKDGSYPINERLLSTNSTNELSNVSFSILSDISSSILPTPPEQLPDIIQAGGICQIIAYLHMIQSQLDWNMDYQSLWKCLPTTLTPDIPNNILRVVGENIAYEKLWNLLFSGKCFVVNELPKKCPPQSTQHVGAAKINEKLKADCDNPCSRKIKIITKKLPNINSEKDLCDRLKNFGPVPLASEYTTTAKLDLMYLSEIYKQLSPGGEYTWDDIKNMSFSEIKNLISQISPEVANNLGFGFNRRGHKVTIVSCFDGVFTVRNSWGASQDFNVSWEDIEEYFIINPNPWFGDYFNGYSGYYPFVEECDSDADSSDCAEERCKQAGYDGFVESPDPNDCDCYCEEIEVPPSAPSSDPGSPYTCLNAGQKIQKIIFNGLDDNGDPVKKCGCPEHPQPDKFYYFFDDCCELALDGSWCERVFCEATQRYYMNGKTIEGNANEYLTQGEFAVAWEKLLSANSSSRIFQCIKEEWPAACDVTPTATPTETPTPTPTPTDEDSDSDPYSVPNIVNFIP